MSASPGKHESQVISSLQERQPLAQPHNFDAVNNTFPGGQVKQNDTSEHVWQDWWQGMHILGILKEFEKYPDEHESTHFPL
jgi:hypothetical protein